MPVIRVAAQGVTPQGTLIQNHWDWDIAGPPVLGNEADYISALEPAIEFIYADVAPVTSAQFVPERIVLSELIGFENRVPQFLEFGQGNFDFTPEIVTSPLAPFTSKSIGLATPAGVRAGRRGFGSFCEVDNDGQPNSDVLSAVLAAGVTYLLTTQFPILASPGVPVLVSGALEQVFQYVGTVLTNDTWNSQVSRKNGQGA